MFPKIPKELLFQLKMAQEIYRQNALSIQLATNPGVNAYLDMKNYLHSSIYPIEQQLAQISLVAKSVIPDYIVWSEFINSAILAYNSTQEEEFKVVIENIPVSIIKPTIKEIVTFYVEQGINIETAFRLAISSYIFIKIYPVIFMINSEELVIFLNQFSKYIYKCGSSVLKLSIQKYYEFQDPEEFAKFLVDQGTSALFGFIIGILK